MVYKIITFLFPLIAAIALVVPLGETMGEDLVLGILGGVIGYFGMYAGDVFRGAVRFHKGVVCMAGHHVSWAFTLGLLVPTVVATMAATWVFHIVPGPWAIIPTVLVFVVGYFAATMGWNQSTRSFWSDDWDNFVAASTGGDEVSGSELLRKTNNHINWLFEDGGTAQTVNEFELLLCQALVFRGYALGLQDPEAAKVVDEVLEKLAMDNLDERHAWLDRDLDDEKVWEEIAPAYGDLVHEVRQEQNRRLHPDHEQEEVQ